MEGYKDLHATEQSVAAAMRYYGRRYPEAGYGLRFLEWLSSDDPHPYNSFGNGAAMRVSAVAWMYHTLAESGGDKRRAGYGSSHLFGPDRSQQGGDQGVRANTLWL